MAKKKGKWTEVLDSFSMITYIGITLVVCILGCLYIGLKIDSALNSKPVFTLVSIVIGVASAYVSLYKTLKKYLKKRK